MAFVAVPAVIGGGAAIAAATTRIRRWTRDGDDDDDGDGFRGYKKVKDSRLAAWAPSKVYDRATQKIVEKALDAVEVSVLDETPYFPRCLHFTNHIKASVWAVSYIKTFYALFSWPFLIFMVPVVGGAFAEARPTAYDKSGMLCPNLSSGQLKTKYDFEKENQIGDFSPRKGWQGRLAMV